MSCLIEVVSTFVELNVLVNVNNIYLTNAIIHKFSVDVFVKFCRVFNHKFLTVMCHANVIIMKLLPFPYFLRISILLNLDLFGPYLEDLLFKRLRLLMKDMYDYYN